MHGMFHHLYEFNILFYFIILFDLCVDNSLTF